MQILLHLYPTTLLDQILQFIPQLYQQPPQLGAFCSVQAGPRGKKGAIRRILSPLAHSLALTRHAITVRRLFHPATIGKAGQLLTRRPRKNAAMTGTEPVE